VLTKSDSLLAPKGTRTPVGSYKNGFGNNVSITKIELESGLVVYHEMISMYDDQRDYIWGTVEALSVLYEQRLAENPVTVEEARAYLDKYFGCYGSSLYQYVVDKAQG
jgi:predicted transcriptional regulator